MPDDPEARIEFWRRMAAQFGGPVLVLRCGTGETAIAIAALGLSVTGVDVGAAKLAPAGREDIDVRWIESDLRDLALPRRFGCVILTGHAFETIVEPALLATVRRHLAPEGAFGFDVDNDAARDLSDEVDELLDAAGFEILAQYGDWDFSRFRPGGTRLVTLCRARSRA